jgi:hypothetical protein
MPDHIQYEDDDLFNPETHHESSDVPVKGLLWFIVTFVVFSIITYFVILFLYKGFANMERKRMDPPQTAVARPATADVPQNQPLLQPFPPVANNGKTVRPQEDTPVADLIKMRKSEDAVLHTYGWVDKQKGVVRIPIEEAMARYAAQAAVQSQVTTSDAATAPAATSTAPASSQPAPSGQPVPPDTGIAPSATTSTASSTGAHQ